MPIRPVPVSITPYPFGLGGIRLCLLASAPDIAGASDSLLPAGLEDFESLYRA
jgi:hypothetical protein